MGLASKFIHCELYGETQAIPIEIERDMERVSLLRSSEPCCARNPAAGQLVRDFSLMKYVLPAVYRASVFGVAIHASYASRARLSCSIPESGKLSLVTTKKGYSSAFRAVKRCLLSTLRLVSSPYYRRKLALVPVS